MPTYATPGVYIEEITGPGVITGVGTSTAAFIGPAARGPLFAPTVITTFDDFIRIYGDALGWPHLTFLGRTFYLGHGVQGFFENGGTRAVIVRVGSARVAVWSVKNSASPAVEVFRLEALDEGTVPNGYTITVSESVPAAPAPTLVYSTASIKTAQTNAAARQITIDQPAVPFIAGDTVELVGSGNNPPVNRNRISAVSGSGIDSVITLERALVGTPATVRLAAIDKDQRRIRIATPLPPDIQSGSLIRVPSTGTAANAFYTIVERTDADGFVYLRMPFQKQNGGLLTTSIAISGAPSIKTLDFDLKVTGPDGTVLDEQKGLSLDPFHGGSVFLKAFQEVRVLRPTTPPATTVVSQLQVSGTPAAIQSGADDNPSAVSLGEYQKALAALEDVDDVNIVCAPDAAIDTTASIQQAMVAHCRKEGTRDRIAVLDVPPGLPPSNDPSALSHRTKVSAPGGFAALYYPWLLVPEPIPPELPRPLTPRSIAVPPSGHIAGVYARVDQTLGVHHAPANVDVMGVMGLERVISDREQGLINLDGVNALRIFPGEGSVVVWGARTTAGKNETDWTYVSVRRLMLYIEESIEEGIRWAVFKPNDRPLWQSLKRTIGDFLERVWRDGGLAGRTREEAYRVRIDEGLNTPADIAKGRLYIEIRVAPVRPAEFIIVRIGLWDGGAEVVEG